MGDWHDKVVLVTGGSAGLGLKIAQAFSRVGCRIVLAARDEAKLANAAANLEASDTEVLPVVCDITSDKDVSQLIAGTLDHFGQLDVLVNNAGRSSRGLALETKPDEYQASWELNCLAAIRVTQAAASELIKARGHLVNIGSLSSKTASPFLGAYPASKFALAGVSHQFRLELAPHGVHVMLVCPGPMRRQDAGTRYDDQAADLPEQARQPGGGVNLRRIDPEQLAARIVKGCERQELEIVWPSKARWLFAVSQLWPRIGDWIIGRSSSSKKA